MGRCIKAYGAHYISASMSLQKRDLQSGEKLGNVKNIQTMLQVLVQEKRKKIHNQRISGYRKKFTHKIRTGSKKFSTAERNVIPVEWRIILLKRLHVHFL